MRPPICICHQPRSHPSCMPTFTQAAASDGDRQGQYGHTGLSPAGVLGSSPGSVAQLHPVGISVLSFNALWIHLCSKRSAEYIVSQQLMHDFCCVNAGHLNMQKPSFQWMWTKSPVSCVNTFLISTWERNQDADPQFCKSSPPHLLVLIEYWVGYVIFHVIRTNSPLNEIGV